MRLRNESAILANSSSRLSEPNLWDRAIADAKELIEDSRTQIRQLKRSIELAKRLRDQGAAFPGDTRASGLRPD